MSDQALGEVLVTQKALVGVSFQIRCVPLRIQTVYKYPRTVSLFRSLLGAFLLSHAHLSSMVQLSDMFSLSCDQFLSDTCSCYIFAMFLYWRLGGCSVSRKNPSVRVPCGKYELWEGLQWFGVTPWYNNLLYSARKWEVMPLSKVTRSTGKFMEKPFECKQGEV